MHAHGAWTAKRVQASKAIQPVKRRRKHQTPVLGTAPPARVRTRRAEGLGTERAGSFRALLCLFACSDTGRRRRATCLWLRYTGHIPVLRKTGVLVGLRYTGHIPVLRNGERGLAVREFLSAQVSDESWSDVRHATRHGVIAGCVVEG